MKNDVGDEFELRTIEHKGRVYMCRFKDGRPLPGHSFKTRDGHELPAEVLAKYGYADVKGEERK